MYGVSMAIVSAGQPQTQDNTMSENVCYATRQDIAIVGNECYGCVPEK